jgi:cell division transport system permease protein
MSVWFSIQEGLRGFSRARMASVISIISLSAALFLIAFFLIVSLNMQAWIGEFRQKIEIEVFLEPYLEDVKIRALEQEIRAFPEVNVVEIISREKAARRFQEEFGRSVFEVLEDNPLPPSLVIRLRENYRNAPAVTALSAKIGRLAEVTDVVYQRELLNIIDHYLRLIYLSILGVGLLLLLIALVLIFNTIRLTIAARRDSITIMQLVGATRGMVRRPFVIEGFLQGLISALIAVGLVYLLVHLTRYFLPVVFLRWEIPAIITALGLLMGMLSSRISVNKYL